MTDFTGTLGNDNFTGTGSSDDFHMEQGGNDFVFGLGAGDVFWFGATYNRKDRVDGGDGDDTLVLEGGYQTTFTAPMMTSVENINLLGDFNFDLTLVDANVAAGRTLTVVAAMGGGHSLSFDGSAETDGSFIIFGGEGHDHLHGGDGDDVIYGGGGIDNVYAGLGDDVIHGNTVWFLGDGALDKFDIVEGDPGPDYGTVFLRGDYSAGLAMRPDTLKNINAVLLDAGFSYTLKVGKLTGMAPHVDINGVTMGASDVLNVSGAGASFSMTLTGGDGNDVLVGGNDQNIFDGNLGADIIKGRGGAPSAPADVEVYRYFTVADSTGAAHDRLFNFDTRDSVIGIFTPLFPGVNAVDATVEGGRLSLAAFDANLEGAIGASELGEDNAVVFVPDRGGLRDKTFLIVDTNGTAGYQTGEDLVIRLENPVATDFSVGNFTTI